MDINARAENARSGAALLLCVLVHPARTSADPGPLLHPQLLLLAIRLEIDGGDDGVADQHGLGEVAESRAPPWARTPRSGARSRRRAAAACAGWMSGSKGDRMWTISSAGSSSPSSASGRAQCSSVRRALELDGHQLLAAHPGLDQSPHARLAPAHPDSRPNRGSRCPAIAARARAGSRGALLPMPPSAAAPTRSGGS